MSSIQKAKVVFSGKEEEDGTTSVIARRKTRQGCALFFPIQNGNYPMPPGVRSDIQDTQ